MAVRICEVFLAICIIAKYRFLLLFLRLFQVIRVIMDRWTTRPWMADGFEDNDAKLFEEYVNSTSGLSFIKKNSSDRKVS